MQSRTKTVLKWTTAVVAAVLIGLSAAAFLLLPRYIETRIVPRLTDSLGLNPASVNIRRIGLWGADVGPVRLGDAASPVIDIASIQVDYSPASLAGGNITGLCPGWCPGHAGGHPGRGDPARLGSKRRGEGQRAPPIGPFPSET
jgi:hypothetical protein